MLGFNRRPENRTMTHKSYFQGVLYHLRIPILQVALVSAVINLLMLVGPIYMLLVYDLVLPTGSMAVLLRLFSLVTLAMLVLAVLFLFRARLIARVQIEFDRLVGERVFDSWLAETCSPDHQSRNSIADLDQLRHFISGPAMLAFFNLPWVPIFLAATFYIHPWLGTLALLGAIIAIVVTAINWRLSKQPIENAQTVETTEKLFREAAIKNTETLRGLGMENNVSRRWSLLRNSSNKANIASNVLSDAFSAFSKSFRLLLQSALLSVGAYLAIIQEISPGMIIASTIIASRALSPLDQLIASWRFIGRALESYQGLTVSLNKIRSETQVIISDQSENGLSVVGVNDATSMSNPANELSFRLNSGEGLAIVGNSASGKSSILRILAGIVTPKTGEVSLNGGSIAQAQRVGHIGYLSQKVEMLPGTIAENISLFDDTASDKDIVDAAKRANVHKLILSLPLGYASMLGPNVTNLSGGQIQRIGLARSIYKQPKLLLLDEPGSNLDTRGDAALIDTIQQMLELGSIVIAVAHRPNIVAVMTKILVVKPGGSTRFGEVAQLVRVKSPKSSAASKFEA